MTDDRRQINLRSNNTHGCKLTISTSFNPLPLLKSFYSLTFEFLKINLENNETKYHGRLQNVFSFFAHMKLIKRETNGPSASHCRIWKNVLNIFQVFDSRVGDAEIIIIFLSQQGLEFLSNSEHWYADDTSKVCPEVFFQVYTVHAQQGGRIFPCFLPNKMEDTYTRFFRELFNHINGNDPNEWPHFVRLWKKCN